jgi:hypothetical protein
VSIPGSPDIYVKSGSSVQLRCVISQVVDPPTYVTWSFNGRALLDFTGARTPPLTHAPAVSVSRLILRDVSRADSGNYSCAPAPALPAAQAALHVIQQEQEQRLSVTATATGGGTGQSTAPTALIGWVLAARFLLVTGASDSLSGRSIFAYRTTSG